jgi:[acyl-carrier-protein] S-malonyltransferase
MRNSSDRFHPELQPTVIDPMRNISVLFPGQGAQHIGMLAEFGGDASIRSTFDEASEAVGLNLWQLAQQGPAELINLTINTQPLMLTAGVACWRAFIARQTLSPVAAAGHSLGEFTAYVAAGAIRFADAVRLVRYRAEAIQNCIPPGKGAMAAVVGLEATLIESVCREYADAGVVEAVNFNEPLQTVIAGPRAAVAMISRVLERKGARRVVDLPVSAPFHSSMLRPAGALLGKFLQKIEVTCPQFPVIANVDARIKSEPGEIRDSLARQVYSPVRWVDTVRALSEMRIEVALEFGPAQTLTALVRRCNADIRCLPVHDPVTLQVAATEVSRSRDLQ